MVRSVLFLITEIAPPAVAREAATAGAAQPPGAPVTSKSPAGVGKKAAAPAAPSPRKA